MASNWHPQETYKGMIAISIEVAKMLALLNGGASLAVLTYVGSFVSRGQVVPNASEIKSALCYYIFGLMLIGAATILGYVTQFLLYNETIPQSKVNSATQSKENSQPQWHRLPLWSAIFCATLALVAFGLGSYTAGNALIQ